MGFADDLRREEEERREREDKRRGTESDVKELIEEFVRQCELKRYKKATFKWSLQSERAEGWVIVVRRTDDADEFDRIGISPGGEIFKVSRGIWQGEFDIEHELALDDARYNYGGYNLKDAIGSALRNGPDYMPR